MKNETETLSDLCARKAWELHSVWSDDEGIGEHAIVTLPGAHTRMVHYLPGDDVEISDSAGYCSVCEARGIDYDAYHADQRAAAK